MLTIIIVSTGGKIIICEYPSTVILWYPQVAGNNLPILMKMSGNKSVGNIIPESIIDGKNKACDAIVSLLVLFKNIPRIEPNRRQVNIKTKSIAKYKIRLLGIDAS